MTRRRSTDPPRAAAAAIAEDELAAIASSLFTRPQLWPDLVLPAHAREQAERAPWQAYWSLRLGTLADPAADRALLETIHAAFDARGDRLGCTLAAAAAIETFYFDETPLEPLDGWIARLDAALGAAGAAPPWLDGECAAEVMACGSGVLLRQPAWPRLADWAERGARALLKLAHGPSRIKLAGFVVQFHLWRGDFAASALVLDALPGIDLALLRPPEALQWLHGVAAYARYTGDRVRGLCAVEDALALIGRHRLEAHAYATHSHGAALALAAHDEACAARHLEAMRARLATRTQADQTHYWHMSAGLALLRGQAQAALALARSTIEQSQSVGGAYHGLAHRTSLACALLAAGDVAAALREAQTVLDQAAAIDARLVVFSVGLLQSHLLQRQGEAAAADRALAAALAVGSAGDYAVTSGWWLPALAAERCAHAIAAGIEPAFARRFARRTGLRGPDPTLEGWPWPLVLRGFGAFEVRHHDAPIAAAGARVPQRPLDLLRALLAHGGSALPVATALEWLWPEADHEQQRKAFDAALLRLRRLLGDDSLLLLDGGRLLLDGSRCWSDVSALAAADWSPAAHAGDAPALAALAARLLGLVRGPLLDGLEAPWALGARERAQRRFVLALAPIAQALEALAPAHACALYERALQADPLAETLSRRLIAARLAQGERAEALRAWHHCKAMLSLHGTAPAADTLALARQASFPI